MQDYSIRFKPLADSNMINLLDDIGIKTSIDTGPWISGGTARRLWFNEPWQNADIDLFFQDEVSFGLVANQLYLYESAHNQEPPHITKNAVTYKFEYKGQELKIQCINRTYHPNIINVWESFDWTVCCFAVADNIIMASDLALKDCRDKVLRIVPNSTRKIDGRRVTKYGIYGFVPSKEILQELCRQRTEQIITQSWANEDDYT
jgi:hypothetical protein